MIKESKIDKLLASLNGSRIAQLLACHQAKLLVLSVVAADQPEQLTDMKVVVKMTKKDKIDAFSSKFIHGQTKTVLLGNNMHIMTQFIKGGDGPHLPHRLSVVNTYTKVTSGGK